MAGSGTLSPQKRRAIACLLRARTVEEAARLARVGERTIWRWLQDDAFNQALHAAEGDVISAATRLLIVDMDANFELMRRIRDNEDGSDTVRLRAAVALDGSLLKWRELFDLETRITNLEEMLNHVYKKSY